LERNGLYIFNPGSWIFTNDGFVLIMEVLFYIVDELSALVFLPAVI